MPFLSILFQLRRVLLHELAVCHRLYVVCKHEHFLETVTSNKPYSCYTPVVISWIWHSSLFSLDLNVDSYSLQLWYWLIEQIGPVCNVLSIFLACLSCLLYLVP